MEASDVVSLMETMREIQRNMVTAERLEQNNKQLQDGLQSTITTAINQAIDQHVRPLIEGQRNMERKFEDLLKRMERVEAELNEQQKNGPGPRPKRTCSAERGREPPSYRHMPSRPGRHPVLERTLRLTNLPQFMTHDELVDIVKPHLTGVDYERLTSQRPRAREISVVFRTRDAMETFHGTTRDVSNPVYLHAITREATTLYWNRPESPIERRRSFLVRRMRDQIPKWAPGSNLAVEINQRTGRIFVNCFPLATIAIRDEEIKYVWIQDTARQYGLDVPTMEAFLTAACDL